MSIESETFNFDAGTPEGVKLALLTAFYTRRRVRIVLGDTETGKQWLEDYDVVGKIGRSWGPVKVPLLINNRRSSGGPAILTACILRIIDIKSRTDLYKADNWQEPALVVAELPEPVERSGRVYTHEVRHDGETFARFTSLKKAENWKAWQLGQRFRPR